MKHIDPTEINIINYLTGEMSKEAMESFENQLENNLLLNERVEAMKIVQGQLGHWKDEDIEILEMGELGEIGKIGEIGGLEKEDESTKGWTGLPSWMKYAAMIVGLGLLLQIFGLKVNHEGNALVLSFGEPEMESLDEKDVDQIVASALDKYATQQHQQMNEFKDQMSSEVSKLSVSVEHLSEENKASLAKVAGNFNRNLDVRLGTLESMIQGVEDNQRQDLEDSFTGLLEFIDNRRLQDQYKIQNAFSEVATAINNQQYKTDALLTSISADTESGLKSY